MIRNELTEWRAATERLIQITVNMPAEEREAVIEEINQLLDIREKLQPAIQAPFTEEENAYGKVLLSLEEQLQKRLTAFSKSIRIDIAENQKKKGTVQAYIDPYSQVFRDGTYYDKRK